VLPGTVYCILYCNEEQITLNAQCWVYSILPSPHIYCLDPFNWNQVYMSLNIFLYVIQMLNSWNILWNPREICTSWRAMLVMASCCSGEPLIKGGEVKSANIKLLLWYIILKHKNLMLNDLWRRVCVCVCPCVCVCVWERSVMEGLLLRPLSTAHQPQVCWLILPRRPGDRWVNQEGLPWNANQTFFML